MKYAAALLLAPFALSANAEMVYPKGQKATITVEYSYQSAGTKAETPSSPESIDWRAKRVITVTETLHAQPAIGVPVMHKQEAQQVAATADMEKRGKEVMVQTRPLMDAAMAAYEKCGDNEACIEREVIAMSGKPLQDSDMKGARENINVIGASAKNMAESPRYQRWESVGQAPSAYSVDEVKNVRSRDPGCARNPKATCTTQETLKGAGTLAGNAKQGVSMFEVDSKDGDIAIALPLPMGVIAGTFTRTTDDPDQPSETKKTQMMFPSVRDHRAGTATEPLVVKVQDLRNASGTLTFPSTGEYQDKGTLTVKWRITLL